MIEFELAVLILYFLCKCCCILSMVSFYLNCLSGFLTVWIYASRYLKFCCQELCQCIICMHSCLLPTKVLCVESAQWSHTELLYQLLSSSKACKHYHFLKQTCQWYDVGTSKSYGPVDTCKISFFPPIVYQMLINRVDVINSRGSLDVI